MYTVLKEVSTKSKYPYGNYEHLSKYTNKYIRNY